MGLHYDLLKNYCKSQNIDLQIIVEDDLQKALKMINHGKADVLAIDLTFTKPRKRIYNFTIAHGYNHQVLVQRIKSRKDSVDYVTSVLELEGKKVYIQKGTVFKQQLKFLQEQTGADFEIIANPFPASTICLIITGYSLPYPNKKITSGFSCFILFSKFFK